MSLVSYGIESKQFRLEDHYRQLAAAPARLALAEMKLPQPEEGNGFEDGAVAVVAEVREFLEVLADEVERALRGQRRWVPVLAGVYEGIVGGLGDVPEAERRDYFVAFVNVELAKLDPAHHQQVESYWRDYADARTMDPVLHNLHAPSPPTGCEQPQIWAIERALEAAPIADIDRIIHALREAYAKPDLREVACESVRRRLEEIAREQNSLPGLAAMKQQEQAVSPGKRVVIGDIETLLLGLSEVRLEALRQYLSAMPPEASKGDVQDDDKCSDADGSGEHEPEVAVAGS